MFKKILEIYQKESALITGWFVALFALVTAFGFKLSVELQGSLIAFISVTLAIAVRLNSTPNNAVIQKVGEAKQEARVELQQEIKESFKTDPSGTIQQLKNNQ